MSYIPIERDGTGVFNLLHRRRCTLLLCALLALLVLYPYMLGDKAEFSLALELLTSGVLLAGLYAMGTHRWELSIGLLLLVPTLFGNWTEARADASLLGLLMVLSEIAFFGFVTVAMFAYVLSGRLLVGDRLQGALSVYLLIGVTFSLLYELLEILVPGSISVPGGNPTGAELLYYSFVTLTTLGYGDVLPATPQAQSLAILESVIGVLYVAVLVSWLVGALGNGQE
ncbi:MAG: potassium channel family protein [Pseudomonadota bacterium]